MTPEQIDNRIASYREDLKSLEATFESTVRQFEQILTNQRNQYQQYIGALNELERIKSDYNGANKP